MVEAGDLRPIFFMSKLERASFRGGVAEGTFLQGYKAVSLGNTSRNFERYYCPHLPGSMYISIETSESD